MFVEKDEKNKIIKKVQDFFQDERDECIGILAAEKVVDFFMEELGKEIYNKAIDDARKYISQYLENMTIDYETLYK